MDNWFQVQRLDIDRLLAEWRWLCPQPVTLLAKNAFGDLFLRDNAGRVLRLKVDVGKLSKVADSEEQFLQLATTPNNQEDWFAATDERNAAARGLQPNSEECIGFSIPIVFAESGRPNPPYVVNIYEHVSFLEDLNQQISELPDGAKVQLHIKAKP